MAETRAASREPTVFHFVYISAVKAPSWFPQELSEETKQHLPPPPSALVHMILEHKREGVGVSRARFTWRSEDCHFNTPTLWWELELTTMLFLLWIPKALKSGVNDLPVSCCILLMDFKDIFPKSTIIPYFAYFLAYFLNVCLLPSFISLTFCWPQYSGPILIVFIKLERIQNY